MVLKLEKKLLRNVFNLHGTGFDWVKVYLAYVLGLSTFTTVALPWEQHKLIRILSPMVGAGLVCYGLTKTTTMKEIERDYGARKRARERLIYRELSQNAIAYSEPMEPESIIKDFDPAAFLEEVTGIAILGNSGSAKTCLVQYFAGELSPNQFLIFDPHADPNHPEYPWSQFNKVVTDYDEILEWLDRLLNLLDNKDRQPLIVIADEYPAIRFYAKKNKSDVADQFILRYGSEARKFNKLPIFISQSGNVRALGLEGMGDFLENFGLIRLGKIAKKYLKNSSNVEVREACKTIAYPMLINEDELYLHPTHGHYKTVKKGQKPVNIKPVSCLDFDLQFDQQQNTYQQPPTETYIPYTVIDVGEYQQLNNCPHCESDNTIKWGNNRRKCKDCKKTFKHINEV